MLTSEWLEALARKPFAYNREFLLNLAERFRAIEALGDDPAAFSWAWEGES